MITWQDHIDLAYIRLNALKITLDGTTAGWLRDALIAQIFTVEREIDFMYRERDKWKSLKPK